MAGVRFSIKPLSSEYVVKYAVINFIKGKTIIIFGISIKFAVAASKIVSSGAAARITGKIQKNKRK